jgi:hypothetical protein
MGSSHYVVPEHFLCYLLEGVYWREELSLHDPYADLAIPPPRSPGGKQGRSMWMSQRGGGSRGGSRRAPSPGELDIINPEDVAHVRGCV